MERLSTANLQEVAAGLLRIEPPVRVVAIGENGLFVPMPDSVPLRGHAAVSSATSALDLVVPDDMGAVIDAWETARRTGAARVVVHPAVLPSSTVEMHFVDLRDVYGVHLGFIVGDPSAGDAEHVALGDALRPRYGVTHKNDLAVLTFCDDSFLRMLGYEREELVGRRSLEIIHPDDVSRAIANWMDLIVNPGASRRVRLRHRRAAGEYLWLEVTNTNLLEEPAHGYVLGETVDISEEMAAVEALRASEQLLRRLTDALPVGVAQLDAEGVVVYRNDRFAAILDRDLPVGAALRDLLPADTATGRVLRPAIEGVLRDGADADREVPVEAAVGAARRVQVALRALTSPDGSAVTGALACLDDVTEAVRLREELAHRATYDVLTGCLTRRALLERLDQFVASGRAVTVQFIDLDGFKPVNDHHGHAVGDALLRHVGERLLEHVGEAGAVGRFGGDEFLVVTTEPRDEAEAAAAAEQLAAAIGVPLVVEGARLVARASIGTAHSAGGTDVDALVAAADAVMYRVKTERRRAARS